MAKSVLNAPHFQNEDAAFEYVEAHLWPRGPVCPHCGEKERIGRLSGKTTRKGLRKCYACRKPFTVRIGSIFEDSHLALHLWLQVIHLMCSSKKGISTRQIQRFLSCSMKTAWHLTHRIRHAMSDSSEAGPLGGMGKVVVVDETYFGNLAPEKAPIRKSRTGRVAQGPSFKRGILSLVERGGEARSFYVERTRSEDVVRLVRENVAKESRLHTDEHRMYLAVGKEFATHERVEGFFSVFKRGMRGIYQQCDEKHLHRYLAEFDFRYNARQSLGVNDQQRTSSAVMGGKGKRLTYQTIA